MAETFSAFCHDGSRHDVSTCNSSQAHCVITLVPVQKPMPARTLSAVAASLGGAPQRVVLWLRNDLRLHDSAVFHQATKLVEQGPCEVQALSPEQWVLRASRCMHSAFAGLGLALPARLSKPCEV